MDFLKWANKDWSENKWAVDLDSISSSGVEQNPDNPILNIVFNSRSFSPVLNTDQQNGLAQLGALLTGDQTVVVRGGADYVSFDQDIDHLYDYCRLAYARATLISNALAVPARTTQVPDAAAFFDMTTAYNNGNDTKLFWLLQEKVLPAQRARASFSLITQRRQRRQIDRIMSNVDWTVP